MTFMALLALLCATGVTASAHLTINQVSPGRLSYYMVRWAGSVFIVLMVASGVVVFYLASRYDNLTINTLAPILYVLGLLWFVIEDGQRAKFHYWFTRQFNTPGTLVVMMPSQVVDAAARYAKHYNSVVFVRINSYKLALQTGRHTVADVVIDPGGVDDVFRQLGPRFIGSDAWARPGMERATLAYRKPNKWTLDGGSGPVGLQFSDPPPES